MVVVSGSGLSEAFAPLTLSPGSPLSIP